MGAEHDTAESAGVRLITLATACERQKETTRAKRDRTLTMHMMPAAIATRKIGLCTEHTTLKIQMRERLGSNDSGTGLREVEDEEKDEEFECMMKRRWSTSLKHW